LLAENKDPEKQPVYHLMYRNSQRILRLINQLLDIRKINKGLASRKITVTLTDAAKSLLVDKGYDPRLGARPLRRVVQRSVENVVSQRLLANAVAPGQTVQLDAPELQATLDDRG
jgi:ATP-dependent Clp protease ATP-binding subunit ClpA